MAGGTLGGGGDEEPIISDINVTPLVDVILVLLIILMVTATAIVSKTIPMDLPKAATGEPVEAKTLSISIDPAGKLYLDREPVDRDTLRQRVRAAREADPEVRALIAADGSVRHARVIEVMDLLRQQGVVRFAIHVQPSDVSPP